MNHLKVDYVARNFFVVILLVVLVVLLSLLVLLFRRAKRSPLLLAIDIYYILLVALFIVGLLLDDGYGVAYIPVTILTLPWYLLVPVLAQTPMIHWFEGYLGNFVLSVVIFGGMNSVSLYVIAKLIDQIRRQDNKSSVTPNPKL